MLIGEGNRKHRGNVARVITDKKRGYATVLLPRPRGLERRLLKRFYLALGVLNVEAPAQDYSQCLDCRPDLCIPVR